MMKEYINPKDEARFLISRTFDRDFLDDSENLMFIWNDGSFPATLSVDGREVELCPGSINCTTYLQKVQIDNDSDGLKVLVFNREFYCVHTHDSEVSCNGLLFFGSSISPVLRLDEEEADRLRILFEVLEEEFEEKDQNQEEMLRILLKRFIIRCTRMAKEQILKNDESQSDIDVVRRFNVLVEEHFKTKKSVGEYAELMFKSPKTVTNVFSKYSEDSPLQVIHKRVIMEAKRMLLYTDKTAKEIGFELGYNDPAQFSKLFKNHTGKTTTEFKNSKQEVPAG
jgi:AraC-like DNA-binding protein